MGKLLGDERTDCETSNKSVKRGVSVGSRLAIVIWDASSFLFDGYGRWFDFYFMDSTMGQW